MMEYDIFVVSILFVLLHHSRLLHLGHESMPVSGTYINSTINSLTLRPMRLVHFILIYYIMHAAISHAAGACTDLSNLTCIIPAITAA